MKCNIILAAVVLVSLQSNVLFAADSSQPENSNFDASNGELLYQMSQTDGGGMNRAVAQVEADKMVKRAKDAASQSEGK